MTRGSLLGSQLQSGEIGPCEDVELASAITRKTIFSYGGIFSSSNPAPADEAFASLINFPGNPNVQEARTVVGFSIPDGVEEVYLTGAVAWHDGSLSIDTTELAIHGPVVPNTQHYSWEIRRTPPNGTGLLSDQFDPPGQTVVAAGSGVGFVVNYGQPDIRTPLNIGPISVAGETELWLLFVNTSTEGGYKTSAIPPPTVTDTAPWSIDQDQRSTLRIRAGDLMISYAPTSGETPYIGHGGFGTVRRIKSGGSPTPGDVYSAGSTAQISLTEDVALGPNTTSESEQRSWLGLPAGSTPDGAVLAHIRAIVSGRTIVPPNAATPLYWTVYEGTAATGTPTWDSIGGVLATGIIMPTDDDFAAFGDTDDLDVTVPVVDGQVQFVLAFGSAQALFNAADLTTSAITAKARYPAFSFADHAQGHEVILLSPPGSSVPAGTPAYQIDWVVLVPEGTNGPCIEGGEVEEDRAILRGRAG